MDYIFSPYQIAEIAMDIEEAGVKFYAKLAARTDGKIKEACLFLLNQEISHRDTFKEIATASRKSNGISEYSVDVERMIQNIIYELKTNTFNLGMMSDVEEMDIKECINMAIHAEEESVRIYSEIYNKFIDIFHDVLEKIIKEENEHLLMLVNVKNQAGL